MEQINEQIATQNEKDKEAVAIYYSRLERTNKQLEEIVNAISDGVDTSAFKTKLEALRIKKGRSKCDHSTN